MKHNVMSDINRIQEQYFQLIQPFVDNFVSRSPNRNEFLYFIEKIRLFWKKNITELDKLIEIVTDESNCFLLSGAIYVGCINDEQYHFKALGQHQFYYDPFIKLEVFYRSGIEFLGTQSIQSYTNKVFRDMQLIMNEYRTDFFVVPVDMIAWNSEESKIEMIHDIHEKLLANLVNKPGLSYDEFIQTFKSYEEIESLIDDEALKCLIFSSFEDAKLSIRERVEGYLKTKCAGLLEMKKLSESEKFGMATLNMLGQISDIILTCTQLRMTPFVRYDITFNYLMLMMSLFNDDLLIKTMIKKSIVAFIFYKTISCDTLTKIDFTTYKEIFDRIDIVSEVMTSKFNDDGEDLKFEKVKDEIYKVISGVIPNNINQAD